MLATCVPSHWHWAALRLCDDHSDSYGELSSEVPISFQCALYSSVRLSLPVMERTGVLPGQLLRVRVSPMVSSANQIIAVSVSAGDSVGETLSWPRFLASRLEIFSSIPHFSSIAGEQGAQRLQRRRTRSARVCRGSSLQDGSRDRRTGQSRAPEVGSKSMRAPAAYKYHWVVL